MALPITTADIPAGSYNYPLEVRLTCDQTAVTKYSVDGTAPTLVYTSGQAIKISSTTTLKFFSVNAGDETETVQTLVYTVSSVVYFKSIEIADFDILEGAGISVSGTYGVNFNGSCTMRIAPKFPFVASKIRLTHNWNVGSVYEVRVTYTDDTYVHITSGFTSPIVMNLASKQIKNVYVYLYASTPSTMSLLELEMPADISARDTTAPVTTCTASGVVASGTNVGLAVSKKATTYYTTDGSTPTTASSVFTLATDITVTTAMTLKYFSVDYAGNTETVKSTSFTVNGSGGGAGWYEIPLSALVFVDDTDFYGDGVWDQTSKRLNGRHGEIHIWPTYNWLPTQFRVTFTASGDTTMRLLFRHTNGNFYTPGTAGGTTATSPVPSPIISGQVYDWYPTTYPAGIFDIFTANSYGWIDIDKIEMYLPSQPTFPDSTLPVSMASHPSAKIKAGTQVSLRCFKSGSTIYYTTNGFNPTTSSSVYSGPLTISADTVLKWFAKDASNNSEAIHTVSYVVDDAAPAVFCTHWSQSIQSPITVALSCDETPDAVINYSLDGTSNLSNAYSLPLTVSESATLKFAATDLAGNTTPIQTRTYVYDNTPPVLTASLVGTQLTIESNESCTIRYTTDSTMPTGSSVVYSGPITLANNTVTVINYYATDTSGNSSAIAQYVATVGAPTDVWADVTYPSYWNSPSGYDYATGKWGLTAGVTKYMDPKSSYWYNNGYVTTKLYRLTFEGGSTVTASVCAYGTMQVGLTVDKTSGWVFGTNSNLSSSMPNILQLLSATSVNITKIEVLCSASVYIPEATWTTSVSLEGDQASSGCDLNCTLTCDTAGIQIYYSLDGTAPSVPYSGPFVLTGTTDINLQYCGKDVLYDVVEFVKSVNVPMDAGAWYDITDVKWFGGYSYPTNVWSSGASKYVMTGSYVDLTPLSRLFGLNAYKFSRIRFTFTSTHDLKVYAYNDSYLAPFNTRSLFCDANYLSYKYVKSGKAVAISGDLTSWDFLELSDSTAGFEVSKIEIFSASVINFDNTAPVLSITSGSMITDAPFNIQASLNETGTVYYTQAFGETVPVDPTTASQVFAQNADFYIGSTQVLKFLAVDTTGNAAPVTFRSYVIDLLPPTIEVFPAPANGIHPVRVSINASDDYAIKVVKYSIDGSEPNLTYSSPFEVSAGTTVKAWAEDFLDRRTETVIVNYPALPTTQVFTMTVKDFVNSPHEVIVTPILGTDAVAQTQALAYCQMEITDLFSFPNPIGWTGSLPYVSPLTLTANKSKFGISLTIDPLADIDQTVSFVFRWESNGTFFSKVYTVIGKGATGYDLIFVPTYGAQYMGIVIISHASSGSLFPFTVKAIGA